MRFRLLAGLAGCLALGITTPALGTDFCVAPDTTCGGTNVATFEAALTAAGATTSADRIFLGAATYTAPVASGYSYNHASSPVDVVGAGAGQTTLTSPVGGNTAVLFLLTGGTSTIRDLTVRVPQNAASGLVGVDTDADVSRVQVVEAVSQVNAHRGLNMRGGVASDVTVALGGLLNTTGITLASGGEDVHDVVVAARLGINATFGATIERATIVATAEGVGALRNTTTVTDTVIRTTEAGSTGVGAGVQSGQATTINLDGLTISGPGTGSGVIASNGLATAESATVNVADTVIRGYDAPLFRDGNATGSATINASYSDYDPAGNVSTGPGSLTQANVTNLGDARFVDAAGGDLRLRFDSPLIGAGEPGAPTTTTDRAGLARLVGARRDIGAYEYQAGAPTAAVSGPAAAVVGEPQTFSALGSTDPDPGEAIASYAWTLDGAAAGTGAVLPVTFATPGTHTVAVTVTDPTGRTGAASMTVVVSAAAADRRAPVLSGLRLLPRRVAPGRPTVIRVSTDEAATLRVEIGRVLPGRRVGAACRAPSRANRARARCTRFTRLATLRTTAATAGTRRITFAGKVHGRALAPGLYRVRVTGVDAAGNRSLVRTATLTVRPA